MKLELNLDDRDRIVVDVADSTIAWTQRTNGTIEWAGHVAQRVTRLFPDFKLTNFSYSPSPIGGYNVTAAWAKPDKN